jgi:hypothetical protein
MTHTPEYRRMTSARDTTERRLKDLERRLREAANKTVNSPAAHRGDSAWRKSDEAAWQAALAELRYRNRNEIGALAAKLERQQAAIRAWLAKPARHSAARN